MSDDIAPARSLDCDVFVLGGGPAGSTIATLLAERGHRVVVAEKERHPRFHIGESLLPLNLPLFERLGVRDEVERIGLRKYGAQFTSPQHDDPVMFDFGDAWDKGFGHAYEVPRAQFDEILFRNCVARGVQGMEQCRVTSVELLGRAGARITARLAGGEQRRWQARFFVDASGRDTFLANQLGIKRRNRATTARRSMDTSTAPRACPAARRAISACSGSSTAGSGSSRCAMTIPASAQCAGPTI